MSSKHLIILDVDGTLVHSLEAEAVLFPQACEEALGLNDLPTGFDSYRFPSDSGIVGELVERHFGRRASRDEHERVEQRFFELISECYQREPERCRPVAGAVAAAEYFCNTPEYAVAIATAGWRRTALHKLNVAGFRLNGLPTATANDAVTKRDIMQIAAERSPAHYDIKQFESVICFGDSRGDANAARELGYAFIGIDTAGAVANEPHVFDDFRNLNAILRAMPN